jgi:arylsulfatase A
MIFIVKLVNGDARIEYISEGNSARFSDETLAYQMLNKARIFIDNNKEQPFSYIFHFTIFMNLDYQTHISS